jgi:hypothetical protein
MLVQKQPFLIRLVVFPALGRRCCESRLVLLQQREGAKVARGRGRVLVIGQLLPYCFGGSHKKIQK